MLNYDVSECVFIDKYLLWYKKLLYLPMDAPIDGVYREPCVCDIVVILS